MLRAGAAGLAALLLASCGQADRLTLRVGYQAAAAHHYRYHWSLTGTERSASGGQQRDDVQFTADARWRVVSVAPGGAATIEQTLSDAAAADSAGRTWRFTVTPQGLVTPEAASGRIAVPGSTQFLSVLPVRPVRPGDSWTSEVRVPGPPGSASTVLRANSTFDRFETWHGT